MMRPEGPELRVIVLKLQENSELETHAEVAEDVISINIATDGVACSDPKNGVKATVSKFGADKWRE